MARNARALVLLSFAGGVAPACLFTGEINQPPTIERPRADRPMIVRDQPIRFTAAASDPDQATDTLEMRWAVHPGGCAEVPGAGPRDGSVGPFLDLTRKDVGPICVRVTVSDAQGATGTSQETFAVENQKPRAKLDLRVTRGEPEPGPDGYELYSAFRASWAGSSDADVDDQAALRRVWQLTDPRGQVREPQPCPAFPGEVCLEANEPGDYTLVLQVIDPYQEKDDQVLPIRVARDQPPCIRLTSPPFGVAGHHKLPSHKPSVFEVAQVKDDGDPWPAKNRPGAFAWSWRKSATADWARLGGNVQAATYNFGADYHRPGDVVQVRVQYRDRIDVERARDYGACGREDRAACEFQPGSGCWQWVTWTVEYY